MLWTDEAVFTRSRVHAIHNMHLWATENPHVISHSSFRQSVYVRAEILDDDVIGRYVTKDDPDEPHYCFHCTAGCASACAREHNKASPKFSLRIRT
jgi:hypothetical protein